MAIRQLIDGKIKCLARPPNVCSIKFCSKHSTNKIEQTLEVTAFNPNPDFSPKIAALHLITAPTHQLQLLAKCALCKYSSAKELKDNTYLKSTLAKNLKGFWIKNQALFHPFSHNLSKSEKNSLEYLIRSSQGNLLHYIILQMNYSKN